jgi:hypothetical protein
MQTSLRIDELNLKLQAIYEALGGDEGIAPPDPAPNNDPINWWCMKIHEALTGNVVNPPANEMDAANWWFQQVHEGYTGEPNIRPPESVVDDLAWWLDQIKGDIENSPSGVPFRFRLSNGLLALRGENLPQVSISSDGQLMIDMATLPAEYTNWRVDENGRFMAKTV